MPSLAELTESSYPVERAKLSDLVSSDGNVPTQITVRPDTSNAVEDAIDKLFGINGKERYQLWPERLVREGLSAAHDVATGEKPAYAIDPVTGEAHTSPKMIEAGQAISALAGTGGLGGVGAEAGASLGAGPFLRPALKYGEKLYKGKEGQQHMDVIPADLYPTFQKQAMNGEDISHWNFGFYNDKGHFLDREKALQYGIDNGLIDPQSGKFGALTSTMFSDSGKPGAAIAANKPFYSSVENAVANAKQPTADAAQWLGFLKNQPGVKQEELAHLGLDKLQGPISREDLLKAVQEGQPQINTVMKGAERNYHNLSDEDLQELNSLRNRRNDEDFDIHDKERFDELESLAKYQKPSDTKYHSYQLPGGENYKEMLLTLPNNRFQPKQLGSGRYAIRDTENNQFIRDAGGVGRSFENLTEAKKEIDHLHNINESKSSYTSSHWDEPNILAHIRMNDRNIDGKKTLHVEEIQSDWHQEGRKKGYKSEENTSGVPDAPFKKTWDELAIKHVLDHAVKNGYDQVSWTPGEAQAARYDLSKSVDRIEVPMINKDGSRSVRIDTKTGSPFKLMVNKEGIVSDGHGASSSQFNGKPLSDVVGKEMADKLMNIEKNSKPYEPITELPKEFGLIRDRNGAAKGQEWGIITDGQSHARSATGRYHATEKEAKEEMLRQINSNEKLRHDEANRTFEGENLKIGGEGMKAFYDKMLVDKFNAIGKKHGAKVSKSYAKGKTVDDAATNRGISVAEFFKLPQETQDRLLKGNPVYTFPITPKLKEQITTKGQPLFSAGMPIYTPVDHDPFEKAK